MVDGALGSGEGAGVLTSALGVGDPEGAGVGAQAINASAPTNAKVSIAIRRIR